MVIQLRGQSIQEAVVHPRQFLCSYDGDVYGDREAKKMAKRVGRDYIRKGGPGQPRLVKSPLEPFGEDEVNEVTRALAKGLVPPHDGKLLHGIRSAMDSQATEVGSAPSRPGSQTQASIGSSGPGRDIACVGAAVVWLAIVIPTGLAGLIVSLGAAVVVRGAFKAARRSRSLVSPWLFVIAAMLGLLIVVGYQDGPRWLD